MINSKRENLNKTAIFTIAILLVLATLINVTLAYFTSSASGSSSSGEIKFGTIAVKVSIAEEENYVVENNVVKFKISADEVALDETYRTLVVENVEGKQTEDFAIRMALSTNVPNNKVALQISPTSTSGYAGSANTISSNWLKGTDNKYYFNKFVKIPSTKKVYIPIKITFDPSLSSADLSSNSYVLISIDIIQAANDGYKSWNTRPTSLNLTETYTAS